MIKRLLAICTLALAVVVLLLVLPAAIIVGAGAALAYLLPQISLEFACVIAGLAIVVGLTILSAIFRLVPIASLSSSQDEGEESEDDDEDFEELAEDIAEIVYEKLEPHLGRPRPTTARRR